ncbi:MAG: arylesterase [Candidatus Manganitrophaceae bacterium]
MIQKICFLFVAVLFLEMVGDPEKGVTAAQDRLIVAFGDSLTAGLGVAVDQSYPAILERKIKEAGYPYRVLNSGVSGETTAGGLRRVDWVLRSRPDIVLLELGANDGLRGLNPDQTEKNLEEIITRLRKEGVTVVLAGMKMPPNYGKEYTDRFEKIYPTLANRHGIRLIPFFLDGVATHTELNQADGIHPTAEGYRVIVDRIWGIVEPLLRKD